MSTVTTRSLHLAVKEVFDKKGEGIGMRSVYLKDQPLKISPNDVLPELEKIVSYTPPPSSTEPVIYEDNQDTVSAEILMNVVNFKIIDLGNATVSFYYSFTM